VQEFRDLESDATLPNLGYAQQGDDIYSDGTLQILSNNLIPQFNVNFKDMFPYNLTTVVFDATDTDVEYFTADVCFKLYYLQYY